MTEAEILRVVADIAYTDWNFHVGVMGEGYYLQVQFVARGATSERREVQHGRKWYLSPHMTRGEIVQTALKAVLAAVEHEAREQFTYKGRAIFGPHFDVEKLVELCDAGAIEVRL